MPHLPEHDGERENEKFFDSGEKGALMILGGYGRGSIQETGVSIQLFLLIPVFFCLTSRHKYVFGFSVPDTFFWRPHALLI